MKETAWRKYLNYPNEFMQPFGIKTSYCDQSVGIKFELQIYSL